jgi:hypothetical protein
MLGYWIVDTRYLIPDAGCTPYPIYLALCKRWYVKYHPTLLRGHSGRPHGPLPISLAFALGASLNIRYLESGIRYPNYSY